MMCIMLMPETTEDVLEVVSTLHRASDEVLCGTQQDNLEFPCMGVVLEDVRLLAYATKYGTQYNDAGQPTSAEMLVNYELL